MTMLLSLYIFVNIDILNTFTYLASFSLKLMSSILSTNYDLINLNTNLIISNKHYFLLFSIKNNSYIYHKGIKKLSTWKLILWEVCSNWMCLGFIFPTQKRLFYDWTTWSQTYLGFKTESIRLKPCQDEHTRALNAYFAFLRVSWYKVSLFRYICKRNKTITQRWICAS